MDENRQAMVLGYVGPLTGEASSIGLVNRVGAELAVEDINKAGGVHGRSLEIIYEDDASDPQRAMQAVKRLIDVENVPVIIGGLSSLETHGFIQYAMDKRVIVFSPGSSSPVFRGAGKYFFRSYPSDSFQGRFAADYAFSELGVQRVAIMYHGNDYGVGVETAFENHIKELGAEVVTVEVATTEDRDYGVQIENIKSMQPNLVFVVMHPEGAALFLEQAHKRELDVPFLGSDCFGVPELQEAVSGLGRYLFVEVDTPLNRDFVARVKERCDIEQVPLGTTETYDNVRIIADLIGKVGTDPDKLAEALHALRYRGVSGDLAFDEQGDLVTAKYVVKRIEGKKAVVVQ